ncbi:MAG: EF-Tu/IF-2/RF-3 family GTPase [Gemmatimonadales bacterium]
MPEQEIGVVTHYFKGPSVAVVRLTAGELAVGDTIRFVGHTSDFSEPVTSMEIDHQKVERAKSGDEVAIQVVARARPHDKVLRVVAG